MVLGSWFLVLGPFLVPGPWFVIRCDQERAPGHGGTRDQGRTVDEARTEDQGRTRNQALRTKDQRTRL